MTFVKGQSGNPAGKKPGTLNGETLTKLERRAMFDKLVSQRWEQIVSELPPSYIADQYLGKATDKLELSGEVDTSGGLTAEVLKIAEEELRKRKLNEKTE